MRQKHRWLLISAVVTAAIAAGGAGIALAGSSTNASGLSATFKKTADWGTGYEATYTIANSGSSTANGWKVEFDLPSGSSMGSSWEADLVRSGSHYTATNKAYNNTVAPGATTSFGFIVTGSGSPSGCTINGDSCSGGGSGNQPTATATVTATSTATVSPTGGQSASPSKSTTATATANPTGSATATPTSLPVAPYVDLGAWPTPTLTSIMSSGNLKSLTLAFITGAACKASWFGAYDPRSGWAKDQIDAVRAKGGDVIVSFGGANGVELAQGCSDVNALETEYQAVVDAYSLTSIDLDIEGAASADSASIERRSQALAKLQKARPNLRISLTLPVLPEGLTNDGLNVVRSAVNAGVNIDVVNVMAMDYYRTGAYGDLAVQAGQSTFNQLRTLYPSATDAQLWRKVGITPMIGQNDDGHVYDQAAAKQLVTFASGKHLGRLAFWEVTRDANACTGALYKCTNISQQAYEFSKIFAAYTG